MSDLTITSGGVAVESNSAGSSISTGKRKIIRVSPTCSTDSLSNGKVIFQSTELPNAVREEGGCSKLIGIHVIDYDYKAVAMNLYFNEKQQNLGPLGDAIDITDGNWKASKPINSFYFDWTDGKTFVGSEIYTFPAFGISDDDDNFSLPCLLQAEPGSTSVYFQGSARTNVTYGTANPLEFVFHIEY